MVQATVKQVAQIVNAKRIIGDESAIVTHECKIDQATSGGLAFLRDSKYAKFLPQNKASAILVKEEMIEKSTATLIVVENPYLASVELLNFIHQPKNPIKKGVHKTAIVEQTAKIGKNCYIAANVYIGENTIIGDNVILYPNVVIMENCKIGNNAKFYPNVSIREKSQIGNNVTIHDGTVVGSDGFGFVPDPPKRYVKIPHTGNVVIGNNVEIGANTTIDRASFGGSTIVGDGCIIDNLVQIAHNVELGKNNALAAMSGLAGSCKVGDWNSFGGQSASIGHIRIGNYNQFAPQTGILHAIETDGGIYMGTPARKAMRTKRIYSVEEKLPEIKNEFRKMKNRLAELQNELDNLKGTGK
jgi:UDP-3-O-[3-hydroxymyristoyl] glucosamine N-acyltransferase